MVRWKSIPNMKFPEATANDLLIGKDVITVIKAKNRWTCDTAGLHEDVMYGIVSTAVNWVIIKLTLIITAKGKLSSLSLLPLLVNNPVLTYENLVKPFKNLFRQIKWVFDNQIKFQESLKWVKTEIGINTLLKYLFI